VKIGLQLTRFDWPENPAGMIARVARAAEDAGLWALFASDHFVQHPPLGEPEDPFLESLTLLPFIAALTERIELGQLVAGVTHRHPGVLVKQITSLDVLSGGRALLGIGAAWNWLEHEALGIPFPSTAERFERLEEALRIAHHIWSEDDGPFQGVYYRLTQTSCAPRPARSPHPPIVVGGSGERKTLKLAARYADAANLLFADAEQFAEKSEVLRRHCEDAGRDYEEIERGTLRLVFPGLDLKADVESLAEAGAAHVVYAPTELDVLGLIDDLATIT
jgi:F420-dependent oxidoreductase-like protein